MRKRLFWIGVLFFCFTFALNSPANAAPYTNIIAYGDSLSDNGFLTDGVGLMHFTFGPVWVEHLADTMDASLFDVAFGGATTGWDNPAIFLPITGLQWQVDRYPPDNGFTPDETLFTVWAGANDLFNDRGFEPAVSNIMSAINDLYAMGATQFLVPNLPDVGKTPEHLGDAAYSAWSMDFNSKLAQSLAEFDALHMDVDLFTLDVFGLFNAFEVGTPEWEALFWFDGLHPSGLGHELIAEAAMASLNSTPIPSTLSLLVLGLVGLGGRLRHGSAKGAS